MNRAEWDEHWSDNWQSYQRNRSLRRRVPLVRALLRGKIADVGVGVTDQYVQSDEITGLDISPECIRLMKDRHPWGNWVVGDAACTGLPESSFDTVVCSHVLEHVYNQRPIIEEMKRIVKPDGNIVIVLPRNSVGRDHVHPKWWPGKIEERITAFLREPHYELRSKDQWVIQGRKTQTVSVVMIAWSPTDKRMAIMKSTVKSLQTATKYPYRFVLVDKGPARQTEFVRAIRPDVHILNAANLGPAVSRNMGASVTDSDYIAFVDNDVEFYDGWLTESVDLLERYPDRKLIAVPTECPVMRRSSNFIESVGDYDLARFGGSACWVMKRKTFCEVGQWTQTVPQDADYAARAYEKGWAFIYRRSGPHVKHLAWHHRTFQAGDCFMNGRWIADATTPRGVEMAKRLVLMEYAKRFGTRAFVETGTYKGDTVKAMLLSQLFTQIWTVDIFPDRARTAKRRFRSFPHIHCDQGDSAQWLPTVLTQIHEPALFWLDAHHSGKQIARTRGLVETPILAELEAVLGHSYAQDSVILIDDARYYEEFPKKYPNYPTTEQLSEMVLSKFPAWTFEIQDDIIRTHRADYP